MQVSSSTDNTRLLGLQQLGHPDSGAGAAAETAARRWVLIYHTI